MRQVTIPDCPCCQPCATCPDTLVDCPPSKTVSVSGLTGDWAVFNGDYTVPATTGTTYFYQSTPLIPGDPGTYISIRLRCVGDQWELTVYTTIAKLVPPGFVDYTYSEWIGTLCNTSGCPRDGNYNVDTAPGFDDPAHGYITPPMTAIVS